MGGGQTLTTDLNGPMDSSLTMSKEMSLPTQPRLHHVGWANSSVITWSKMFIFSQPLLSLGTKLIHSDHEKPQFIE
jgi:hypothetical protein